MWLKWFPWRFIIKHAARGHGFLDPVAIESKLHRFAQPSEVSEPIELLRAGVLFHARGLINARAIQHNLDWIWPYWVQQQFDPRSDAFIPRAFSITHVNLTHRNWTAVGRPDDPETPIIDPRGLVTPFWDSWSLDSWIMTIDGRWLVPARLNSVTQRISMNQGIGVITESSGEGLSLHSRVQVDQENGGSQCNVYLDAVADGDGWLVVSVRPYNPEGVSFVHEIKLSPDRMSWTINGEHPVYFDVPPSSHGFSDYRSGDVYLRLPMAGEKSSVRCDVGLATAAVLYKLKPNKSRKIKVGIPLASASGRKGSMVSVGRSWEEALQGHAVLEVPDKRFQLLYDAAVRALILHSPGDVYPGPYTYKRFWFRDAAFILHAMLCVGLSGRVERSIDRFRLKQTRSGYFKSQEGEWDSNGEALWIMQRFCELTGKSPKPEWLKPIRDGGRWIQKKRLPDRLDSRHGGLLPAGFSAEHLGPNDYYYWDDFWAIAGLRAAASLLDRVDPQDSATAFRREADAMAAAVERSLDRSTSTVDWPGIPASPYRRMDAGAIGSLVAGYPLKLWSPMDRRLLDTTDFLMKNCLVNGGFFLDMIHSGINPYLTLHIAQVLLRAGDMRFFDLVTSIRDLASPTGQWPEAIHPRTGGGCMGDGQHIWASAEWVLMTRNIFVREEGSGLILASGIPRHWVNKQQVLSLGSTPTPYGSISVSIESQPESIRVAWTPVWRNEPPVVEVRLPGFAPVISPPGETCVEIKRKGSS